MSKKIWIENFTPRHSEVDAEGRLKIRSLLDYLQEAAANHAADLGCDMKFLRENHKIWVLSRLKLRCFRTISLGEQITVRTYPNGFDKIFATRQFQVLANGIPAVEGSSFWLLLALPNLRPLRPAENLAAVFPDNSGEPDYFAAIDKLTAPAAETLLTPLPPQLVGDAWIDLNNHLNNAEYAGMIHNFLAELLQHTPQFSELQINFMQATERDELMTLQGTLNANEFFIQGLAGSQTKFQSAGRLNG